MVSRLGRVVPLLLITLLFAACAGSATGGEQELPTPAPADSGFVITESVDQATEVVDDSPTTPLAPDIEEGIIGLSAMTTRGHVWADPAIDGDEVAVPVQVASLGDHVHFEVGDGEALVGFIGYFTEGGFFVRASYCPNCGGQRIEWGGSLVVCRSCEARFDAVTGRGEEGARGYPEGAVPCTVSDGFITMSLGDLVEAHARTVAGESTLFELPEPVEDEDRGDRSWPRCCAA